VREEGGQVKGRRGGKLYLRNLKNKKQWPAGSPGHLEATPSPAAKFCLQHFFQCIILDYMHVFCPLLVKIDL
jgi:hypothetical protein